MNSAERRGGKRRFTLKNSVSPAPNPGKPKDQRSPDKSKPRSHLNPPQDIHARYFIIDGLIDGKQAIMGPGGSLILEDSPGWPVALDYIRSVDEANDALLDMANHDLISTRESKPITPMDLLKCDLTKPLIHSELTKPRGPTTILLDTLVNYYYYKEKGVEGGETAAFNLFHSELTNLICRHGWTIILYLREHRVITKPELETRLNINKQSVGPIVKKLVKMGLLKPQGKVGAQYCGDHRRPIMYGDPDATDEDRLDAQRRYAILTLGYDPREKQQIKQAQMAEEAEQVRMVAIEARAEAAQVQKYVDKVVVDLEPHHAALTRENRQIIETHMKEAGVPEPIWVQVREGAQRACLRTRLGEPPEDSLEVEE